jgi:hypothetical protein
MMPVTTNSSPPGDVVERAIDVGGRAPVGSTEHGAGGA